ncbi:MAG: host attachment protein [Acidiferrobacterales bacterium]
MNTNWLLVANRTGARLFENAGPGRGLTKLQEFSHPEGRLKDQDFVSDDKGRVHDRPGQGSHKREMPESPSEHENRHFAHDLAKTLQHGLDDHRYTRLFLVAEPGFLGDLKEALDKKTASVLEGTLGKDLLHVEDREIPDHLDDLLKL